MVEPPENKPAQITATAVQREWVQCRFCEFAVHRWFMLGSGASGPGGRFASIRFHVKERHPEEYERIQAVLDQQTTREHGEEASS